MSNVLSEEKKQQILALGKLRWSLRSSQDAVHVRREIASAYLKAAKTRCVHQAGGDAPLQNRP